MITDALRRYLSSHSAELSEAFIREDVEWGLRGEGYSRTTAGNAANPPIPDLGPRKLGKD